MKHTTLNIKEHEKQRTSRITTVTEVSKITGLIFCINSTKTHTYSTENSTVPGLPWNTHIHSGGHGMSYV
jgi:hypothetical protein